MKATSSTQEVPKFVIHAFDYVSLVGFNDGVVAQNDEVVVLSDLPVVVADSPGRPMRPEYEIEHIIKSEMNTTLKS